MDEETEEERQLFEGLRGGKRPAWFWGPSYLGGFGNTAVGPTCLGWKLVNRGVWVWASVEKGLLCEKVQFSSQPRPLC